jgi:ornithine cyclodeaminase/alanine dehydrogenase
MGHLPTLVLSQADVRMLLTMEAAVPAVEAAFAAHARGEAQMPPKVYVTLPEIGGDFRAMPATLGGSAGVKWVNSHPANPAKHGLPAVMGVYVLSDPETALPLAIMDATWLTAVRTGAAAAVASKYLAKKPVRSIGFVGCGVQARTMLAAHRVVFGDDLAVVGADVREDAARRFADEVSGKRGTVAEACACDVVCASTPGKTVAIRAEMLEPGVHVNAMGADAEGKQEIEEAVLRAMTIVVDDPAQALHSGEINVAVHHGTLREADLHGTIGEVVIGKRPGRTKPEQMTLFDSTGLAIQDVAVARVVLDAARAAGRGVAMDLVGVGAV